MKKLIVCLFLFVGCSEPKIEPSMIDLNKKSLSSDGEFVGTLKDGRKLIRYEISMGKYKHTHWVYVVDGSTSVNYLVNRGKNNTSNETMVFID
jgi:hypothetical protein